MSFKVVLGGGVKVYRKAWVDMLGRMLATFLYVFGICALLYVSIYLPYANPLEPRSEITWENLRLWVPALVWVLIASVSWAIVVRTSSEVGNNDAKRGDREDDDNERSA